MSHKTTVMAVVNQKGGTGKTTTCENLGVGLAKEGKKVLLVDTDPQASLTISLGYPKPDDFDITLSDMKAKVMQKVVKGDKAKSVERMTAYVKKVNAMVEKKKQNEK